MAKYHYATHENRVYRFSSKTDRDAFVWDCQAKPRTRKEVEYALVNAQPWEFDDIARAEFIINPTKGKI